MEEEEEEEKKDRRRRGRYGGVLKDIPVIEEVRGKGDTGHIRHRMRRSNRFNTYQNQINNGSTTHNRKGESEGTKLMELAIATSLRALISKHRPTGKKKEKDETRKEKRKES